MEEAAAAGRGGGGGGGGGEFHRLPEGCVSHVLSLTSPRDACRSAAVSWTFRSAVESDAVWERFLPPDYGEIVSRAPAPVDYSSKRDLFFQLCGSVLIDGGRKSFALERSSGKKCFMLSAKELVIVWGDTPEYWRWDSHPESRFSEVAVLLNVCWLEIRGNINCRMLSQNTKYVAYLIFKLAEDCHGLDFPQEASVKLGAHTSERVVCLHPEQHHEARRPIPFPWGDFPHLPLADLLPAPPVVVHLLPPMGMHPPPPPALEQEGALEVPEARGDGWMEVKIGEFFNDEGDDGEVDMCLTEIKRGHWKNGLVVEGIEVRPGK